MASENNNFQSTVNSLFKGMDSFITTKTVVGDAITVGDTIILPLVDVTFGVAATAKNEDKKQNGGGGMGGKMSPSAVLVIQNGTTKINLPMENFSHQKMTTRSFQRQKKKKNKEKDNKRSWGSDSSVKSMTFCATMPLQMHILVKKRFGEIQ